MNNINCSANCKYQYDGKCMLEKVRKQKNATPKERMCILCRIKLKWFGSLIFFRHKLAKIS